MGYIWIDAKAEAPLYPGVSVTSTDALSTVLL